jgi:hypothetical protein
MHCNEVEMRGLGQEAGLQIHDLMPSVYEWSENHVELDIKADVAKN